MPRYHLTIKDRTEGGVTLPACQSMTIGKLDFRRYTSIPSKVEGMPDETYPGAVGEYSEADVEGFRAASGAWDGRGSPVPLTRAPEAGGGGEGVLFGELVPGRTLSEAQVPRIDPGWRAFAGAYDGVARLRARFSRVHGA